MPKDKEPTSLAEIERLYQKYLDLPDKWSENELKMARKSKKDQLFNEQFDVRYELMDKIYLIIRCKWDSDTVKLEIENLFKQWRELEDEIIKIEETEDHSHPELKEETN